ncbi:retrotransposon protein, putative, ty1-copia subclass, partial [Tanacetum coccineum]
GLRGERKLKQGALYLCVGNGVRAQVEAIGSDDLVLPNGLVVCLDNFSKNYILYFNAIPSDGIYEIDMLNLLPNVNSNASYFITFMDDYSRYGYVYLLKHKHDVFEIFKVFNLHLQTRQSKRRNHTLLYMVQSMMNLTTLSLSFWDYALESATRILNVVPTKKVDKKAYELWYGKVPNLSYLKETMGYYFYFPPENKIVVASEIPMEIEGFKPPQEEVILVRRSIWTHRAPKCLCLKIEVEEHSLGDLNEPTNYKAALLDPESDKWLDAMNAEIQSMKDNQVWRLVDPSPNCKTVGSKWLFKKKTDMDGNVHTYKSCLVAKSFTQTYEVDYEETFSPVADIRAIRIILAIAAFYDYEICWDS